MSPLELKRRAEIEKARVKAEMVRLARLLWKEWKGDAPMPSDDNSLVKAVLAAISEDHPDAEDVLEFCRAENARLEQFVREKDIVGLPTSPLKIIWTPEFLRSHAGPSPDFLSRSVMAGAMLMSPGPLDKDQEAFFAITPIPPEWSQEQKVHSPSL